MQIQEHVAALMSGGAPVSPERSVGSMPTVTGLSATAAFGASIGPDFEGLLAAEGWDFRAGMGSPLGYFGK